MTTRALVVGATGFVGRTLVEALRSRGIATVAHVRPDSARIADWRERFTKLGATVDATAWDRDALTASVRALAPTHVWNVIGTTRKRAKADQVSGDIYQAVDVGLTRMLVEAVVASEVRPRLIQLSSVGASTTASSAYLRARGEADEVVVRSGLSWAIARPSFIVGEGRDDRRRLEDGTAAVANVLLGAVGLFGAKRLRDTYRSITPDALAAALIRLGLDDRADHIVTGPELR